MIAFREKAAQLSARSAVHASHTSNDVVCRLCLAGPRALTTCCMPVIVASAAKRRVRADRALPRPVDSWVSQFGHKCGQDARERDTIFCAPDRGRSHGTARSPAAHGGLRSVKRRPVRVVVTSRVASGPVLAHPVAVTAVPSHGEGDLMLGLESSAISTHVERTTRCILLLHLPRLAAHATVARTAAAKNGPPLDGRGAAAVRDVACLPAACETLHTPLSWGQIHGT